MSAATAWPGFQPLTDPEALQRAALQLSRDFPEGAFRLDLTDAEMGEYLAVEERNGERRQERAAGTAQGHRQRAARLLERAGALDARAIELEDEAAPTRIELAYVDGHPALVENKVKADRAPERLTLDEAAQRLHRSRADAVIDLGVSGVIAADDGTYASADVATVAADLGA